MRRVSLLLLLLATGCVDRAQTATEPGLARLDVPGTGQSIVARLCRPVRPGPAPLAVINHGSPVNAGQRAAMRPASCEAEAVRWFVGRGFAVLLPLRRGYGASGGPWAEDFRPCSASGYAQAGRETARDIAAAIRHGLSLPDIRPDGVVVVGQSAGGWGSLALAGDAPPGVAAVVNMAGGRGGWADRQPNTVCGGDAALTEAAGRLGRAARLPTLWIYTANDSYFSPALATAMHRAFTAPGAEARLVNLPAFGRDGHSLFFATGGSAVWGAEVEPFLRARAALP